MAVDPIDLVVPRLVELRQLAIGRPSEAMAEVAELRRTLRIEPGSPLDARLDCVEARALFHRGELRRALEIAARAERATGAPDAIGTARHLRALVFGRLGHHGASLEAYDRAIATLVEVDPHAAFGARVDRAGQLRASGRLDEAATAFDALVGDPGVHPTASAPVDAEARLVLEINAASCWHQVGRVSDAARALARAEPLLGPETRPDLRRWWNAIGAWVEVRSGRAEVAAGRADDALADAPPDDLALRASAIQALARAALLPDAPPSLAARAWTELRALAAVTVERGLLAVAGDLREALADLAAAAGDPVSAVEHLRERERLLERQRAQDDVLRMQAEDLRLELVRFELEAERLRAGTQELEASNRVLEQTDLARRRLLHSVAHDLRGLVHAFLIGTEMLDPDDPDQVRAVRGELEDVATRMQRLVDGTLSDESIRTGVPRLVQEPVDLGPSLEALLRSFGPLARARGCAIRLEVPRPVRARCDPVALARIVDNLVGNALKYGTAVTVTAEGDGAGVMLRVEDDGPGFATSDAQRALVLGERLGADGGVGRGIGLHVVYDLVSRLGGVVEIGNRPEGGARVTVRLP